jgi:hypothetical protein
MRFEQGACDAPREWMGACPPLERARNSSFSLTSSMLFALEGTPVNSSSRMNIALPVLTLAISARPVSAQHHAARTAVSGPAIANTLEHVLTS